MAKTTKTYTITEAAPLNCTECKYFRQHYIYVAELKRGSKYVPCAGGHCEMNGDVREIYTQCTPACELFSPTDESKYEKVWIRKAV
ncbi:hypothetical protein [uncultured Dysosmobacter sp.]|uniref:hypothetical protein n=1 Tax=uncultured Dysosmobacter sp. TaxID=2591384 RepID=UPI002630034A|nr:hypothetical protein [uncultured Dysosmobacter sp.]